MIAIGGEQPYHLSVLISRGTTIEEPKRGRSNRQLWIPLIIIFLVITPCIYVRKSLRDKTEWRARYLILTTPDENTIKIFPAQIQFRNVGQIVWFFRSLSDFSHNYIIIQNTHHIFHTYYYDYFYFIHIIFDLFYKVLYLYNIFHYSRFIHLPVQRFCIYMGFYLSIYRYA